MIDLVNFRLVNCKSTVSSEEIIWTIRTASVNGLITLHFTDMSTKRKVLLSDADDNNESGEAERWRPILVEEEEEED